MNNAPEHSYDEEDQSQHFINRMFDEITDLETLLAPELLSMAQTVQVTVHNFIFKTTLQFILMHVLFT